MNGREDKKSNDLKLLGKECIAKIYDLADIYHSDNIDRVSDDLIKDHNISNGEFDNIAACEYSIPTHWDIGKVYKRLIIAVSSENGDDVITTLMDIYTSQIVDLIEDYNSSFYYDNPAAIFATYKNGCIPE